MTLSLRRATLQDLIKMQEYLYHLIGSPNLCQVAVDPDGNICGYVMGKLDEEAERKREYRGHVTSVSVRREYRRLGLAKRLLDNVHSDMKELFECDRSSLHVRAGNRAAIHLYHEICGYKLHSREKNYYADGEDAFDLRLDLTTWSRDGKIESPSTENNTLKSSAKSGPTETTTSSTTQASPESKLKSKQNTGSPKSTSTATLDSLEQDLLGISNSSSKSKTKKKKKKNKKKR